METFWFDDFQVLFQKDKLDEFIPTQDMTEVKRLNAIMRFCIYLSIILMLVSNNTNYLFIVIGGALLTYYIKINNKNTDKESIVAPKLIKHLVDTDKKPEKKEEEVLLPNSNNLFGNSNPVSVSEKKTEDPDVNVYESQFDELLKKDDFQEQDHMFIDKMSLRSFYKVPNTYDSDSRKKFLDWCYKPKE
jgi:hypothetical protein